MNNLEFLTKLYAGITITLEQRNYPNILVEITYTHRAEKPYFRFNDYRTVKDYHKKESVIRKLDELLTQGYIFSKGNYINDFV